jgi:hypothetical protein
MPLITWLSMSVLFLLVFMSWAIILSKNYQQQQSKLVGWALFVYSLFFLSRYFWFDLKIVLDYPHLLGLFSPVMFLAGPLFYFISRNFLIGRQGLSAKDYLHFLPAVFHFLEMIPFYLQGRNEKMFIAETIVNQPEFTAFVIQGEVPGIYMHSLRMLLFLTYLCFSFYFMVKYYFKNDHHSVKIKHSAMLIMSFFLLIHGVLFVKYFDIFQYYFTGEIFVVFQDGIKVSLISTMLLFSLYSYINTRLNIKLED